MCYWQEKTFFVLFKRTLNTVYTDYFNAFQKPWNSRVFLNIEVWYSSERRGNDNIYYVAEFDSGQDEENPVFWLATQAHLAYSEFPTSAPQGKIIFFRHIINLLLNNRLARSRWLGIDHPLFYVFIDLAFVSEEKWRIYNTTFQGPHDSINKWDVNNITIEEMEDMRRNIFTYWLSKHFGSQGIGLHI